MSSLYKKLKRRLLRNTENPAIDIQNETNIGEMYHKELLRGLATVPTPNNPGTIIVTGESQAILTTESGEVTIAATQHSKGRIIAFAHDVYLQWLFDAKKSPRFNGNVFKWLTGQESLNTNEKVNIEDFKTSLYDLDECKLVIWNHLHTSDIDYTKDLLYFLENGGSILCASCPWGWLQLNPGMSLQDMALNTFLKGFGMSFTSKCLYLGNELVVSDNQADYSNFESALDFILNADSLQNKDQYWKTLSHGFAHLGEKTDESNLLGLVTPEKLDCIHNMCISVPNLTPSKRRPICDAKCQAQMIIFAKSLNLRRCLKAPGIEEFPGDYTDDSPPYLLKSIPVSFDAKFAEWHSTGYYLPAGVECTIKVNQCIDSDAWSVRIGAHTDDLSNCESICRWPCISLVTPLGGLSNVQSEIQVSSPYGGLIYFESHRGNVKIQAVLNNVVNTPYFDLTVPNSMKEWKDQRTAPGLWAELAGHHIVFTTPSSTIRELEDPTSLLQFWDQVVQLHHTLRGTSAANQKRERIVNDIQASAGYMHSGYPIVTHLDVCQKGNDSYMFELANLKRRGSIVSWGLFHELGHNMQRSEWTFEGATEVTVNFFSLHAYHLIIGDDITQAKWLRDQKASIKKYLKEFAQPTYENWKSDFGVALYTFAVLFHRFGWESLYTFMKNYERDMNDQDSGYLRLPNSNQEKLDQWVLRYSDIVGFNIGPHFRRFGLPVSADVDKKLTKLKPLDIDIEPDNFFKRN